MNYEIDEQDRVWLNDGIIIANCGKPWNDYQEWLAEGNEPSKRIKEQI